MIIKTHGNCDCGDYCEWCSVVTDDTKPSPRVTIEATDTTLVVTVNGEEVLADQYLGMATGADLFAILQACGIRASYDYSE